MRGDIGSLPFRDESFDLVTANTVVEHLADPERQFREIGRVLRPGGTLLLHTPNALGYPTMIGRLVPETIKGVLIRALDSRPPEDVFPYSLPRQHQTRVEANGRSRRTDAMFALVPPMAAVELMVIRLLMTRPQRGFRSNLIAALTNQPRPSTARRP